MAEDSAIGTTIDRSAHTVLVVDDNPATRYSTARVLRAAGFATDEAADGAEALALAQGGVSAVVLDVHLPDMDGFDVCRALRQSERLATLPVIYLSAAYVRDEDKVIGLNAGADAYLTHPAEPRMLVATVQALIRARMAEDRLRQSEDKFRAIYVHADTGIALIDAEGHFAEANPALAGMMGRLAEAIIGKPVTDFVPADRREEVGRQMAQQEGDSIRAAFPMVDGMGTLVHMEWVVSQQAARGLRVAVISNISERVKLEQQRQELLEREQAARAAAERHSRTKDDFVAVLSHELRNPLNAIVLSSHTLLRRDLSPEVLKGVETIRRNANTQARLISDILDVSRINSGKLTLQREHLDAGELLTSSLESTLALAVQRGVKVETEIAEQLPPALLDAARFQQVFWNLFSNAVKFSEAGGTVRVSLGRRGNMLVLRIEDHGKGIEPEFLSRIFEKFSQSDAPGNRRHGGLGLGMSIVRDLTELHGGRVSVQSEGLGRGAVVEAEFPIGGDAAPARKAAGPDAEGVSLARRSILVVEDDVEAASLLTLVLSERGARVAQAVNVEQGLVAYRDHAPELVISDIGLPGRDGYDLIREIRQIERGSGLPRIPAIALTAFGRPGDRDEALRAGFDLHIAKPLSPHVLLAAIASLDEKGRGA
ncbi:MAG: response regulator [Burkholderiaceae bacterium]